MSYNEITPESIAEGLELLAKITAFNAFLKKRLDDLTELNRRIEIVNEFMGA